MDPNPKTGRQKNKTTSKISVRTRNKSSSLYGGSGSDLHEREPCTWREMITYFYFLKLQNENASDYHICELINEKIKSVWQLVNSALPLLSDNAVVTRIFNTITKVNGINRKKGSTLAWKKHLNPKLDKLFDISACLCELPDKHPCKHRYL